MHLFRLIFLLLLSVSLFTSCQVDECPDINPSVDTIDILPLGDSRVDGFRPNHESYRYWFWENLINDNWEVDFFGTRSDDASYPKVQGKCFDNEHEGTGGATTVDILQTLANKTFEKQPEVVLLGIGGNDLLAEVSPQVVIQNIREIVTALRLQNDRVTILLEQIAPGRTDLMTPSLQATFDSFNSLIPTIADSLSDASSKIVVVNMAANWRDSYMADQVHYNEAGAKEVADRYFSAFITNVAR